MAAPKTVPTDASVEDYLNSVPTRPSGRTALRCSN